MGPSANTAQESVGSDVQAFEAFFRVEYPRLVAALYLVGAGRDASEDLAQDALALACERWARISAMESPGGYVFRVALNLHRKHRRRSSLTRRFHISVPGERDTALEVETRSALVSALATLPRGQREAIVLVEWFGLSAAEAGLLLGIEPASVRSRCSRARDALRHVLEVDGD